MPQPIQEPLLVVVIVALVGFMIGLSKGGLGGGLGSLMTPMLGLVLPNVALAVGVLLPMLMFGDVFAVRAYWKEWDGTLVRRTIPGSLLGVVVGTFLLAKLPADSMRLVLGLLTLTVVGYKLVGDSIQRLRYRPEGWHGPVAGAVSGFASALANAGGPPFSSFLLLQKVPPRPFIATTAVFFALLNLIKVPGFLLARVINLSLLASLWWVFPFIPLGNWIGRQLATRINRQAFERLMAALLVVTSILLIWQSLR